MPTLHFKGKEYLHSHHLTVPFRGLEIDKDASCSDAPSLDDNLILHGDNLHALKALMPKYAGKVKCIYIDPPYNTGNEGWCYNDNVNSPTIRTWLEKSANPVDKDDMERHDKWLCMIWPRLQLLRELLADDGVIFVSIDDNEVHHLRMMMDEIFGEKNFVTEIAWQKKVSPANDAKYFSGDHESILLFAKNINAWSPNRLPHNEQQLKNYKNVDDDPRGDWNSASYTCNKTQEERPNLYYGIVNPFTGKKVFPKKTAVWAYGEETSKIHQENNLLYWGKNGDAQFPRFKKFLSDAKKVVPRSIWMYSDVGSTQSASTEIKMLFPELNSSFPAPNPSSLLKRILQVATSENSIILDSFAGSGTTAHAVLALNAEEKAKAIEAGDDPDAVGNRTFILVEMEEYAKEVTAERVRRVIEGVPTAKDKALQEGLGGSFTFATLGEAFDIDKILTGEHLPSYTQLANYVFHTATGGSLDKEVTERADYFIGDSANFEVYLIYKPDLAFLRSNESALNVDKLDAITSRKSDNKKQKLVFATAKYMGQDALSPHHITFCQIPYAIHRLAGN